MLANKRVVFAFLAGLIIGVLLVGYTPLGNRYFFKTEDRGAVYKFDTWTGHTWFSVYGRGWTKVPHKQD